MSIFSYKKICNSLKDDNKPRLVGYINKESGRQSIYGYLLDKDTEQPRAGVLCIDDNIYEIECNIFHESIEKKFGHGNHGYKLYIPSKHKDGREHTIKLIDKQTWHVCAEEKIHIKGQDGSFYFNDEIGPTNSYESLMQYGKEYIGDNASVDSESYNKFEDRQPVDNYQNTSRSDLDVSTIIGKIVKLDEKQYLIIKPNNKKEHCISLQNVSTGFCLQHQNGRLFEVNKNNNSKNFIAESSFIPETRGDGFVLRCANQGFEESYICKLDIDTYIVSEDLVEFVFYALPYGNYERDTHCFSGSDANHCDEHIYGCMLCLNDINYLAVPANDGKKDHISLLNMSNGCYVLVFNEKITEKQIEQENEFNLACSSFIPELNNNKIILNCAENEKLYVSYNEKKDEFSVGKREQAFSFPKACSDTQWENIKEIISNFGRTSIKIVN